MNSLRNYLTKEQLVERINLNLGDVNEIMLQQAETDIDNALAYFSAGAFRKCFVNKVIYENVTLTATSATIPNQAFTNGYLAYSVMEILSGSDVGKRIAIKGNTSNVLDFLDSFVGLTGTVDVSIYQVGKFPMLRDVMAGTNKVYKTIPEFVKQAVALQYQFLGVKQTEISSAQKIISEELDEANYTVNYEGGLGTEVSLIEMRIHPQALDLLDQEGLTIQTL